MIYAVTVHIIHYVYPVETKNSHHDLDSSRALVSGSLERGAVARGGRLGQARGGGRARGKKAPAWIFFSGLILLLLTLLLDGRGVKCMK